MTKKLIFEFIFALPLFLSNSLYPLMLQDQKNLEKSKLFYKYLFVFLGLSVAVVLTAWFFAPLLGFIKQDFTYSVLPFRILSLFLPFFFVSNFLQWRLISYKKQKFLLLLYLSSGVVNIGLNIVFIPVYGYLASAVITGFCEGIVLLGIIGKTVLLSKKGTYA